MNLNIMKSSRSTHTLGTQPSTKKRPLQGAPSFLSGFQQPNLACRNVMVPLSATSINKSCIVNNTKRSQEGGASSWAVTMGGPGDQVMRGSAYNSSNRKQGPRKANKSTEVCGGTVKRTKRSAKKSKGRQASQRGERMSEGVPGCNQTGNSR